jgi:hypothetical protein
MTVTRLESSDASFVYSGVGWVTTSDASASGGSYRATTTNGDSVTITVATSSGYTGFLIGYTSTNAAYAPSVTVDGAAGGSIAQFNNSVSANVGAYLYQRTSQPFAFVGNATHTILLTAAGGGMTVDFIEYYTAETPVVGRCTSFGHSIMAGFGLGSPATQRFSKLVANAFGMSDDNFGVSSEDLTNGNNRCNGVLTDTYNQQTLIATSASSGAFNLVYTPYPTGTTITTATAIQWNDTAANVATKLNAVLGAGAVNCTIGPLPNGAVVIQFAGASTTYRGPQNALGVSGSMLVGGTATVNGAYVAGTAQWNSVVPTPGWSRAWTGASAVGDNWFARRPELALLMHGLNDVGYATLLDPTFGANYGLERFKARLRELLWRMQLNCPNTKIVVCGICYTNVSPSYNAQRQAWSAAIAAVCGEATMKNVSYIELWLPVVNNGQDALMLTGGSIGHPTDMGHEVIARELTAAVRAGRGAAAVRLGL